MTEQEAIRKMKAPKDKRQGIWRGGVLQIQVTRSCTESCFGCTQASNLAGKPAMMTPEQFETACQSLRGYWGVVGVFGGDPCMSPHFEEICEIFCRHFPFEQRGLWSNNLCGKGAICRKTFNPAVSNLNVHTRQENYDEFKRDWPEAMPFGLESDSRHGPPFVAMQDVGISDEEIWKRTSECDVNQRWSALIGVFRGKLRAYVCELMCSLSAVHENDQEWPDLGHEVVPGWWQQSINAYADQIRFHCRRCGMPLKGAGDLAINGTREQVSKTHADWFRPKVRGRPVELVASLEQLKPDYLPRATDYVQNAALPLVELK